MRYGTSYETTKLLQAEYWLGMTMKNFLESTFAIYCNLIKIKNNPLDNLHADCMIQETTLTLHFMLMGKALKFTGSSLQPGLHTFMKHLKKGGFIELRKDCKELW